jgi:hypothetical protein
MLAFSSWLKSSTAPVVTPEIEVPSEQNYHQQVHNLTRTLKANIRLVEIASQTLERASKNWHDWEMAVPGTLVMPTTEEIKHKVTEATALYSDCRKVRKYEVLFQSHFQKKLIELNTRSQLPTDYPMLKKCGVDEVSVKKIKEDQLPEITKEFNDLNLMLSTKFTEFNTINKTIAGALNESIGKVAIEIGLISSWSSRKPYLEAAILKIPGHDKEIPVLEVTETVSADVSTKQLSQALDRSLAELKRCAALRVPTPQLEDANVLTFCQEQLPYIKVAIPAPTIEPAPQITLHETSARTQTESKEKWEEEKPLQNEANNNKKPTKPPLTGFSSRVIGSDNKKKT